MSDNKTVEALLDQAYTLIETGQLDQAIEAGKQLVQAKHARGFEIVALAQEQKGQAREAISTLLDGVSKVPRAWPLWESLGNIYTNQNKYPEAEEAYKKALQCPQPDNDSINYHFAFLLGKEGKFDQAFKRLQAVSGEAWSNKTKVLRASFYNSGAKHNEALQAVQTMLNQLGSKQQISYEEARDYANAFVEAGKAHLLGSQDRQKTWEMAWCALQVERNNAGALWLVREFIKFTSPQSHWWKIKIKGKWPTAIEAGKNPPSFSTVYDIVADSVEKALKYAQEIEPLEVRDSMTVEASEDLGEFPQNVQGVYLRTAYQLESA